MAELTKGARMADALKGYGWGFTGLFVFIHILLVGRAASSTADIPINWNAVVWCFAWLAVGGIPGFLFGIPKVVQRADDGRDYTQMVNTNLEQVSDWLTKILLGVGLVELRNVADSIGRAAAYMSEGLGVNKPFCAAIIIGFSIEGFLFSYLTTRLVLARAFRSAEQESADGDAPTAVEAAPLPVLEKVEGKAEDKKVSDAA